MPLSPSVRHLCRSTRLVFRRLHTANSTVNQDEISHFSRLSSQWWDEQGEFSFLHRMNPVRVQFIQQKLVETAQEESDNVDPGTVLRGLDILDVGCGGGLLSESLSRLGAHTLGIDASQENIAIASLHASADPKLACSSPSLSYLHTPAETLLSSSQKRYDVLCSMEVLEHVDNPAAFLSTCAQLVKPGGHLFLSTIARTPLAYTLTILFAEYILQKVSKGTHTYSKFVNPNELINFFKSYPGASADTPMPWISPSATNYLPRTQAEVRGLVYNPIKGKWLLAPRGAWGATDCNYLFWVRKPKAEEN